MGHRDSKILVLGASGLLGSRIFLELSKHYSIIGTAFKTQTSNSLIVNLDVNSPDFAEKIIALNPKIIINCIAFTNVDLCESQRDLAWHLNAELPKKIAELAKTLNAKLIHISTDHFNFETVNDRSELAEVRAVNFYGESKLAGEKSILATNNSALIVRTNFFGTKLFPHIKGTFFESIIKNTYSNRETRGYKDIHFSPISISELIRSLLYLLPLNPYGVINICGNSSISKYEFCIELVRVMNCSTELIQEVSYEFEPNSIKRPLDMSMSNHLYCKITGKTILSYKEMLEEEYSLFNEARSE